MTRCRSSRSRFPSPPSPNDTALTAVVASRTSARPASVISANVVNNTGYINFATSLSSLPRSQQLLAVGQLVLTADDVDATKGLEIRVAGTPQELLLPNGKHTMLATPSDFQSLLNA